MQRILQPSQCPECGNSELVADTEMGELVCGECGLVLADDMFDQGPEWRAFTLEEKRSKRRVGGPTTYSHYDKGLNTTIWVTRDAFGSPLPAKTKRQMWRLRKWDIRSRAHASGRRNLIQAMNELERLCEKLHIPSSVQETAAVIYRKALRENLVRGRSIAAIVAASLYAACRLTRTPKTLHEIVKAGTRDRKEIGRCYRMLLRKLEMKVPIHDPLDYLSKIAEKAGIPSNVQGLAVKILREAEHEHITVGKDPSGIVAAALYIACKLRNENITLKNTAIAANVTEVTIRNRKKELITKLGPFPDSWMHSHFYMRHQNDSKGILTREKKFENHDYGGAFN